MTPTSDIMEELYRIKDEYAARFGYDLNRMVDDLKQKEEAEKQRGRKYVSLPPRRCQREFPYAEIADDPPPNALPIDVPPAASDSIASTEQ